MPDASLNFAQLSKQFAPAAWFGAFQHGELVDIHDISEGLIPSGCLSNATETRLANLTNPTIIWLKGGLFVLLGVIAAGLLIADSPNMRTTALVLITVWAFCRAYYFAFYVVGAYVDPNYRFAGLIDFAKYAFLGHSADRRNESKDSNNEMGD